MVVQVAMSIDSDFALELRHGQSGVHTLSKQSVRRLCLLPRAGRVRRIFPAPLSLEGIRGQRYFQRLVRFIEGLPIDAGAADVQRSQTREQALPNAAIASEGRKESGFGAASAETPGSGEGARRPHFKKMVVTLRRECFDPFFNSQALQNVQAPIAGGWNFAFR